jgi:predicted component of type VI protein secretion system
MTYPLLWHFDQRQRRRVAVKITLQVPETCELAQDIVVDRFPFLVGRCPKSDYVLNSAFVSRKHFQLIAQGDTVLIQDLESHNGTFLNGKRISAPVPVQPGDEVNLGPVSFRVNRQHAEIGTVSEISEEPTMPECRAYSEGVHEYQKK